MLNNFDTSYRSKNTMNIIKSEIKSIVGDYLRKKKINVDVNNLSNDTKKTILETLYGKQTNEDIKNIRIFLSKLPQQHSIGSSFPLPKLLSSVYKDVPYPVKIRVTNHNFDPNNDEDYFMGSMCRNTNISEKFYEYNIDKVNWCELCKNTNMSEAFFERHLDKVIWGALCGNTNMFEAFFERHLDKVNWCELCKNTNMSEAFFERHLDRIYDSYWIVLCQNTNMSEDFFERHIDKVLWRRLCQNTNISEAFFERHLDKVDWESLYSNTNISEAFFERHIQNLIKNNKYYGWVELNKNSNGCFDQLIYLVDHIDQNIEIMWLRLCKNTNLSETFFERHLDNIVWSALCENTNISEAFFERHLDKLDEDCWEYLCKNTNISEAFFKRHIDKVVWKSIFYNKNISHSFIENNASSNSTLVLPSNILNNIYDDINEYYASLEYHNSVEFELHDSIRNLILYYLMEKLLNQL